MEWAVELIDWLVGNHAAGVVFVYMFTSLCWGSFPCNIEVPYWATLRFLTRQRWSSLSSNTEVSYKVALDLYLATLRFLYQTMLRFFTKVPCQATLRIFTWQCWGFLLGSVEALCLAALRLFAWQCWGSLPGSVEALCLAALRLFVWQRWGSLQAMLKLFTIRSLPGPIHIVCSHSSSALLSLLVSSEIHLRPATKPPPTCCIHAVYPHLSTTSTPLPTTRNPQWWHHHYIIPLQLDDWGTSPGGVLVLQPGWNNTSSWYPADIEIANHNEKRVT